MPRHPLSLPSIALLSALCLPACGTYIQPPQALSSAPREAVQHFTAAPPDALSPQEHAAMDELLASVTPDSVTLAAIEAGDPSWLHSAKLAELTVRLSDHGIGSERMRVSVQPSITPLTLHLHYRAWPLPERCPDWRPAGPVNQEDTLASHIGCASALNFQRQVADPSDLIKGRGRDGAQTETAVRAIERHFSGELAAQARAQQADSSTTKME